jgi:hypothetical protein
MGISAAFGRRSFCKNVLQRAHKENGAFPRFSKYSMQDACSTRLV